MIRGAARQLTLALAVVLLPVSLEAEEERKARVVRPSYPEQRSERSAGPPPEAAELPASLRVAVPRPEPDDPGDEEPGGRAVDTRSAGDATPDDEHLRQRARRAAAWAADEAIERHGRPRYFEIGFHDGLHEAFDRTRHDRWEWEEGRRVGSTDREARGLGEQIGSDEALAAAAAEAQLLVIEQFSELGREPLPLSPPPPPPFSAAGFTVAEPELRQVFDDLRWRGTWSQAPRHLSLDPWRLFQAERLSSYYDADWRTFRFALDLWSRRHRGEDWWRRLDRDQRERFEGWFEEAYSQELGHRFGQVADRAFGRGYDAGWRHGIRVGREWQFRRGYHLGFEQAVMESARQRFAVDFRSHWSRSYDQLFHEWLSTVKLQARAASLVDGNRDGVFEPGEELLAEVELVNLGGASGRGDLTLEGVVLETGDRQSVHLERRSVIPGPLRLRGALKSDLPAGRPATVTVSLADYVETFTLQVSHVLTFEPGLELVSRDVLRGEGLVEIRLHNASRRSVAAQLDAAVTGGALRSSRLEIPEIAAGASHTVRLEVAEARPLDLLDGSLALRVAARTGGRDQGRLEARFPMLAIDLSDDGLVRYLVWLAGSPAPDRADAGRAQSLMLRRLEADWQVAAAGRGNPYKSDLRSGGTSTALGALVRAARGASGPSGRRTVLTDLVPRIDELSRSLPGNHPFLRRSMRKLAHQLL